MASKRQTSRSARSRKAQPTATNGAALGRILPLLLAVVAAIVILGFAVVSLLSQPSNAAPGASAVSGITCDRGEHNTYHVHAQLRILVDGTQVPVPANVGVRPGVCLYWLHTHDASGLLHVEAPTQRDFTLGQFFQVWGEALGPNQVGPYAVGDGQQAFAFVDGQAYTGDLGSIQLVDRRVIELQIGAAPLPPGATTSRPPG
jgi:hypothetical protein